MSSLSLSVDSETDIAHSPFLQKIFAFLDWKSKKVAREVCRFWKEELDDSGLNIKIDNGCCGNVGFASKALARKINVVNIDTRYKRVQLKYPNEIISVKCIGKIEPLWFIKEILTGCENLTELHLTGSFLVSQELGNLQRVRTGFKILMQNLRTLRIEFGLNAYEEYLKSHTPEGTINQFLTMFNPEKGAHSSMRQILDTNMSFLLTQIRSPKLDVLYIFVDAMPFYSAGGYFRFLENNNLEWKDDPISGFLDSHRTLTRIYLPNFQGRRDCNSNSGLIPNSSTGCPEKLKTLEITLIQPQIESAPPSFMQKLLLAQKSLKEIRYENTDWDEYKSSARAGDDVPYRPLNLKQVFANNSSTLTYIHLNLHKNTKELLTGYTFQNCHYLETFILEDDHFGGPSKFNNFNALPRSLKTIHIGAAVVVDPELCQTLDFKKFDRLQILALLDIRVTQVNLPSFTATISTTITSALRSRRLNYLGLWFSNDLLLFRDKKLTDAIVALAKPTDQVDIYEPLNYFELGSRQDNSPIPKGSHFLSIPHYGDERIDVDLSYARSSNERSAELLPIPADQVIARSSVYNVPYCGVLETCWGIGCRLLNPASIQEE